MTTLTNFEDLSRIELDDIDLIMWDMDGTLVKTENLHALVNHELMSNKVLSALEIEKRTHGQSDYVVFEILKSSLPFKNAQEYISKKNEYIKKLIPKHQDKIIDERILSFLQKIKNRNISLALVTSSQREVMQIILEVLDLNKYFSYKRCFEDNEFNKPDPAPYLRTLFDLKIAPERTIILEDSDVGLKAALASGVKEVYKVSWYM